MKLPPHASPAEVAAGLRAQALTIAPFLTEAHPELGAQPAVGAMLELGLEKAVVSLFASAVGDASLYFSTGGGVIGGVGHERVRDAARRFVAAVGREAAQLRHGVGAPPAEGELVVHAMTPTGLREVRGAMGEFERGAHPLSALFALGNALITEMRLASERENRGVH
jgi:hypothetical protein